MSKWDGRAWTHNNKNVLGGIFNVEREFDIEWEYKNKIKHLEKNSHLHKIIDRFYKNIDKFIKWISNKFNFGDSKELVKKFENDTFTLIDPVKQMKKEEREKELSYDK